VGKTENLKEIRMKDCVRQIRVRTVLMTLAAMATMGTVKLADGQEHGDFREIISRAKSEVFPALIFVKPIVEDYGSGEKKQQEVFGSGVIISPDGYAVTNWHVVDKAVTINCVLYDKRQVPVEEWHCREFPVLSAQSFTGGQEESPVALAPIRKSCSGSPERYHVFGLPGPI